MSVFEFVVAILSWIGLAITLFGVLSGIVAIFLWFRGILPVVIRLGSGLANRKIAIFASAAALDGIIGLLEDSTLVRSKNLVRIPRRHEMGRAQDSSIMIVNWADWAGDIDSILSVKRDQTALIVLAEPDGGRIPPDVMERLNHHRNTSVCNFRGRLMNDLVLAMVTTAYAKK